MTAASGGSLSSAGSSGSPILARIPRESSRGLKHALGPRHLSAAAAEAYRILRATLDVSGANGGPEGRVLMITGSSPSEGKSTTAVNLASSLALAGNKVILIEADLRRPALGEALDAKPTKGGVVGVLIENANLKDALTPIPGYGMNFQALLADYEGGWIAELFSIPAASQMIDDARRIADYVVIDSPPLNEVVTLCHWRGRRMTSSSSCASGRAGSRRSSSSGSFWLKAEWFPPASRSWVFRPRVVADIATPPRRAARAAARDPVPHPDGLRVTADMDWQRVAAGGALGFAAIVCGLAAGIQPLASIFVALAIAYLVIAVTDLSMGLSIFVFASFVSMYAYSLYDVAARTILVLAWSVRADQAEKGTRLSVGPPLGRSRPSPVRRLVLPQHRLVRGHRQGAAVRHRVRAQRPAAADHLHRGPEQARPGTRAHRLPVRGLRRHRLCVHLTGRVAGGQARKSGARPQRAWRGAGLRTRDRNRPDRHVPLSAMRLVTIAATLFVGVGILLTTSRSALIALVASLPTAILLAGRWRMVALCVTLVLGGGAYIYFKQFAPASARQRIEQPLSSQQRSEDGRNTIWSLAFRAYEANPIVGVGRGTSAWCRGSSCCAPASIAPTLSSPR